MKSHFKIQVLQYLTQKRKNLGFTLTEILVAMVILGVFVAMVLPNLLGQIAKGRQAEAKTYLGVIDRAQQAYNGEKGTFTTLGNTDLGVSIDDSQYYSFSGPIADNNSYASHTAIAVALYSNAIKNYASAVSNDNTGNFAAVICESIGTASGGQGAVAPGASYAIITGGVPCATGNQIN